MIENGGKLYGVVNADCLDVMKRMSNNSVDAIVTDPPYGLDFMGKNWDHGVPGIEFWKEALRVAKPGAHLLAFGGTRTYHRLACAIEDAGWEVRDCLGWIYSCLSEDTEILTVNGWAKIGIINIGDYAIAYDLKTRTFRIERVEDTHIYDYDDTAYHIVSDTTDQLVSRNHRVIVERNGVETLEFAENIAQEHEARVPLLEDLRDVWNDIPMSYQCASHQSQSNGQSSGELDVIQDKQRPQTIRGTWRTTTTLARIIPEHYKGRIWCITVPSGTIVARRNGKVFITGNSGFPKSMDISKAIDKKLGAERKVIGKNTSRHGGGNGTLFGGGIGPETGYITEPSSDDAKKWNGWGTCLKPAYEPVIMARKPLEGTVVDTVLKYGTGGLNIDECRVPTDGETVCTHSKNAKSDIYGKYGSVGTCQSEGQKLGRFPANLIHDGSDEVLEVFPNNVKGGTCNRAKGARTFNNNGEPTGYTTAGSYTPIDSAARFFYCSKASKKEKGEDNPHPTVKPIELMKYLVKLIAPKGALVLDPFMGSGTTGVAAIEIGRRFLGIEKEPEYFKIAETVLKRLNPNFLMWYNMV